MGALKNLFWWGKKVGYLTVNDGVEIGIFKMDNHQIRQKYKRRTRGLILTHLCNLNCIYCYIPRKFNQMIPLEIAQSAVADVFKEKSNMDFAEVEIDFAGAEPLTAFQRMREISEWIWSQQWSKPYILFATTNGTLLNTEMKAWFTENKDKIVLGLSCDSNIRTQDHNRNGSFAMIDFNFFWIPGPSNR